MTAIEVLQSALADRYAIQREIGAGGMATVYLARDLRHQRDVALKVLKPELGAVLGAERFLSEIRVTANLQHPNLLPLFDSGEAGGLLYYVMPFVAGETLRARIDREKQLPVDEAVRIAVAVASALGYAHEHGVIHRDLKPENILIQAGQPVIADFGIALAVSNAGGARVTQTGLSLGTPQYMSPEQAAGDREIDARSDIYSLGAVTYEMLAGEPPHSGTSAQAIIAKLMTKDPAPLHSLRRTVPVNVACAVEKALAKLPADRFGTAQEFATALTNSSFTISTGSGAGYVATGGSKRWKTVAIAATAAALFFATAFGWTVARPAPAKPVVRYALALDSTEAMGGPLARLAVAPDGSAIVYQTRQEAKLILRERSQLHGSLIPGVENAGSPFFSSDGSRIGYVKGGGPIQVVSLSGGPPVQITDSAATLGGGSFGDGGYVYFTHIRDRAIVRSDEAPGSRLTRITALDTAAGELEHYWAEPLPNGKGLLFTIWYRGGTKAPAIGVVDLSTGKHHVLLNGTRARYVAPGRLLYSTQEGSLMTVPFDQSSMTVTGRPTSVAEKLRLGAGLTADFQVTRDGTLVYVAGTSGADRELVWVDRSGKIEQLDAAWKGQFNFPALSPDGKHLAVSVSNLNAATDVWVKQLDRGPALRLTFEGTINQYPVWTADGASVTFDGNVRGKEAIWTKRADGSAQAVLQVNSDRELAEAVWSRDRKWLVVRTSVSDRNSLGDILALRVGVDTTPVPLLATNFSETQPTLSPDGRWMAYRSNETGRNEIYVVPFPNAGSAKWPVSTDGGSEPIWSHSGRELFYRTPSGNLVSVAVTTSPTFSAGGTTVLFPEREFVRGANHQTYDVSPDDKRFVFARNIGSVAEDKIIFVENWLQDLNKKK